VSNIEVRPPNSAESKLLAIESLRAVAALLIVVYHMVLLPTPNIELPKYLFFIKERFGLGVPLFYALSGFVLAFGYLEKLDSRAQIRQFYVRRFFRIAPLFYTMLLVWLITSKIKWGSSMPPLNDIVFNMLFLFGLVPGKHESIVWAGWSIGVEMIFYAIFPLITAVVTNVRSGVLAYAVAILVGSAFYNALTSIEIGSYAYLNIVTHLPNFIAGVLAFLIWKACGEKPHRSLGIGLMITVGIATALLVSVPEITLFALTLKGVRLDLYIWSLLFMGLILAVCFWPTIVFTNKVSSYLGKISFSLYLWHPLVIVLILQVYPWSANHFGAGGLNLLVCLATTLCVLIPLAALSFRYVETRGIAYGKAFSK
jgi:peptidoglycan/LPS O-acetylase OafA/YrhL